MFYTIVEVTMYNHASSKSFCNDNKMVMFDILYFWLREQFLICNYNQIELYLIQIIL